jgi:Leucine-rich repeat (LRR) protein
LNELQCWKNQLTSLDVSKNKALSYLSCEENQLTSLDVSSNTTLTYLECGGNQLTSLNMRNGVNLELYAFNATENPNLTCIETLDPAHATTNLFYIDAGVTFSVICGGTDLTTWHVATTGSDGSGSGTSASPLATIQTGVNAATENDTVSVAAGTYVENIKFKGKNIAVIGADRKTTIIDGNESGSVVTFENGENSTTVLKNFTITNSGGFSEGDYGGGIFVDDSKPILESLIIDNNNVSSASYQGGGGGVCVINNGKAYINNLVISNTSGRESAALFANKGGDIKATNCLLVNNNNWAVRVGNYLVGSGGNDVELINCTVTKNLGPAIMGAGETWGTVIATNSIIYNNIDVDGNNASYSCNEDCLDYNKFTYSLVQGGHSGIGNIDADPLFCDTLSYKYYDTSPAVGAGENGVNMGAMGVGCDVPLAFTWVTPSEYDAVNITKENLNTEYIVKWTTSKDIYNDSLRYHIVGTGGNLIVSTSDTSNSPTYQELLEEWPAQFQMLSRMTYVYDVWATDGKDSTKITGEPRKLYINRYEYLSTEGEGVPVEFALHENYPNPFNPTTTLRFDLPEISDITLTIYNMLGQKVRTFNYQNTSAGYHSITWNATNDFGEQVGAGVYLYQLQTKDFVKTRKMVLLK